MNGIIILALMAILLILGSETTGGAVIVMIVLCFVVYLHYNQKICVDRCTILGKTYYKKSTKTTALLREFYLLPDDQHLLVISLPDAEENIFIKTKLHHDCATRLEVAYQNAKRLNDPLPINVLVYDDSFGDKQYRIPDNWDSDLSYVNDVGVITIMNQKKTPDEIALIMHVLSEILIGIALVLLFSNEKAALVLLIIGISGMILFVPSSKIRLTKITKCGIIGASKTKKTNNPTASATKTDPSPAQAVADVKPEEVDDDPLDGPKSKKTAAVSTIQSITQKYEQGKGSQTSAPFVLSVEPSEGAEQATDTVFAADATSSTDNEQNNSQKAPSTPDEQADTRSEDPSRPSRSQKSGRKKAKGASSKTSRTRKRKNNPKESSEGEQISFLSVLDESELSDTDDSHPSEEKCPVSDATESKESVHIPTAVSSEEERLPETTEVGSNDTDDEANEPAALDDLMQAECGIFMDGPMDEDDGSEEGDAISQSDSSDDDAEVYGDLASLGVIDEEDDNDNIDISSLNEPTHKFDSTEVSGDQDTTSDGVEVISQDDIEIVPTKKYRRNLYGDTLMKRRNNDTPPKIDFVIES